MAGKKRFTEEEQRRKATEYGKEWRKRNPDANREINRRYRNNVRYRVLAHYSGGEPKCACCGVEGIVFLTLDHINNDGAQKRREHGSKGGVHYYRKLIREGFPEGYQTLCWNCNAAKVYGACPHQLPT